MNSAELIRIPQEHWSTFETVSDWKCVDVLHPGLQGGLKEQVAFISA